jgi:hypothetical protein
LFVPVVVPTIFDDAAIFIDASKNDEALLKLDHQGYFSW